MRIDKTFSWIPKKLANLGDLNITVVGGTGGLGRAISRSFADAGANVTVVGQTFRDEKQKNIKFVRADLSSINESRKVARELDVSSTHILVFTTGIFAASKRQETSEGLERDMAVSFLNRMVMVPELVSRMHSKENFYGFIPRVFIMAYPGSNQLGNIDDLNSEKSYGSMKTHMNTVAGNEALVYDSVSKYKNVHFYGLNPGLVKTNIRNNLFGEGSWTSKIMEGLIGWFTHTPEQYALGISPLLIAKEIEGLNGGIFNKNGESLYPSKGFTPEYASKYIKASEDLLISKNLF